MRFIGVDVGISGAVAVLDEKGKIQNLFDMPVIKYSFSSTSKKFSLVDIQKLKMELYPHIFKQTCFAAMERIFTAKGSANGAITSGINYGRVWSALELAGLKINIITSPRMWQKKILETYSNKIAYDDTKHASIAIASNIFKVESLIPPRCKTPRDGRADALLIAEYLRLREIGDKA
jgi:hypothetical protein